MAGVSLLLEESGDLVFRLNGYTRQGCDDAGCLEFRGGDLEFRTVLVRLLEQWRDAVTVLRSGEAASLPYEFQDEYTGWLQVVAVDEQQVDCLPISRSISGWSVDPLSNRGWHGGWEPVDYRPGSAARSPDHVQLSRQDLLDQIFRSIAEAQRNH